jgi:hypothetical protein
MIKLSRATSQGLYEYHIKADAIVSIELQDGLTYINLSNGTSYLLDQSPEEVLELMKAPTARFNDVVMVVVTEVERAETSGSQSPMWRCWTDDNVKFNIFKHEDEQKDNFGLFAAAGWADLLEGFNLYETRDLTEFGLIVALQKSGAYWNVFKVRPFRPAAAEIANLESIPW